MKMIKYSKKKKVKIFRFRKKIQNIIQIKIKIIITSNHSLLKSQDLKIEDKKKRKMRKIPYLINQFMKNKSKINPCTYQKDWAVNK